jgi:hypothetical protein
VSEEYPTLGQRLDGQARRRAARSASAPPWAAPFGVLVDHLAGLPSADGRFARIEAGGAEPERRAGEQPSWAAGPETAAPGRPLPVTTVARLNAVVGRGAEAMRVHDDDTADEVARTHRADAVTVGTDVFFRHGRFDPEQPSGFGLLVHEATHVVERLRPGASVRHASPAAVAAEEHLALTRETAAAVGTHAVDEVTYPPPPSAVGPATTWSRPAGEARPPSVSAPHVSGPAATPSARPMTAAVDRHASAPTAVPPAAQAGIDVDALRNRIVRDLMHQLRDEFERGA